MSLGILSDDSAFSEDYQKLSQDESGHTSDALEAFLVLGKYLKLSLPDLHPLGFASSASHDYDFLKIHYLGQEVKLIKKMGFYLTSLYRPSLGRTSSKGSLSGMIRGLLIQWP